MAYFEFNAAGAQVQNVRQLKQALINAKTLAELIQQQNAQMSYVQQQNQFGVPDNLAEVPWESTIDNVVTALNSSGVENIISQLGFSS
jgi:hypothetical protein